MAKWVLTARAQCNLVEIVDNVIQFTGYSASGIRLYNELIDHFHKIAFMPYGLGTDIGEGRRQTFCRKYRIIYRIWHDDIYILTVIHSSRIYPRL